MIIVTPCFNFDGRCEEAIAFYQKAFGARTDLILRYSDADKRDWDIPLTVDQEKLIYHAEMMIGNQRIMLSDIIEFNLSRGTSLFLTLTFEDAESVKEVYEVLKDGSTLLRPMISTTYSSCFVSLVDKFGIRWGLMTEQAEK